MRWNIRRLKIEGANFLPDPTFTETNKPTKNHMSSEELDLNSILINRREAVKESIQPISLEELKNLGENLFPFLDHPWRAVFFDFLKENANSNFYHAETRDRIHVLYCRDKERGLWFIPGSGMGPLQEKALKTLKEIVDER